MSQRVLNLNQFFRDPEGKAILITAKLGENRTEQGYVNHEDMGTWDALHRGWRTITREPIRRD